MSGERPAVDALITRIRRTLSDDVATLLHGAADPLALVGRIRAHLLGLLAEADEMIRSLRAEAEQWRLRRTRAEQEAAVEAQLALLASETTQAPVVASARQRSDQRRTDAAHAAAEEQRLHTSIEALLAVVGSLRAMLARLTGDGAGAPPPPQPGGEHMARAAELVGEIDALNERAFQRVREMRARADGASDAG